MLYAIKNKKTNRLLRLDTEFLQSSIPEDSDWYEGPGTVWYILRDAEFHGMIYTTTSKEDAEELLRDGKTRYPDTRIEFGWGQNQFAPEDLELVEIPVPDVQFPTYE